MCILYLTRQNELNFKRVDRAERRRIVISQIMINYPCYKRSCLLSYIMTMN